MHTRSSAAATGSEGGEVWPRRARRAPRACIATRAVSAGWRTAGLRQGRRVHACGCGGLGVHRVSVSRHERSREGRARRAGGCAAGLLERRGRGVQQREGPDRGAAAARARRAPSGRREGGAGSARAGGSANSSDEAGEFNGRGPRAARSAVAAGSAYRGRVARAAARGGQQVGGLPAYSSNEDGEACGCARARRALFVVLVILKKRSGSPPNAKY